jgi:hypothetical protein
MTTSANEQPFKETAPNPEARIPIGHQIQVTSFGGAGTTMLRNWLVDNGASLPQEYDSGIWKHLPAPPTRDKFQIPEGFRAIYLIGDPVESLLSVFGRNYHMWHAVRMQSHSRWPSQFLLEDAPVAPPWGLKEFLNLKQDCFGIHDQFAAWTTTPKRARDYPILIIKYDKIWDHLPELADFLEFDKDQMASFPARRERSQKDPTLEKGRRALQSIYGNLAKTIEAYPDCMVI